MLDFFSCVHQGRYNRIDFKQRSDKKMIPKLMVEADKLKQKLQSVCDTHLQVGPCLLYPFALLSTFCFLFYSYRDCQPDFQGPL